MTPHRVLVAGTLIVWGLALTGTVSCSRTPIEISLRGWVGGDPFPRMDCVRTIRENGDVVITYELLGTEMMVERHRLSIERIDSLAAFLVRSGFFSLDSLYDCGQSDTVCMAAKRSAHLSTGPLTLSARVGENRHSLMITILRAVIGTDTLRADKVDAGPIDVSTAFRFRTTSAEYPPILGEILDSVFAALSAAEPDTVSSK